MIKYQSAYFWTPTDNFERVKKMLTSEFGLVPPHFASENRIKTQLVWEDSSIIGRYRVNFSEGQDEVRMDIPGTKEKRYIRREELGEVSRSKHRI